MSRLFFTILLLLYLAGCTSPATKTSAPTEQPIELTLTVTDLLRQAELSDPIEAAHLRLAAAGLAFAENNISQAQRILDLIPRQDVTEIIEFLLLSAEVAVSSDSPEQALNFLNERELQTTVLNSDLQIRTGLLRSAAYQLNRSYIASARERIYLDPLLPDAEKVKNHDIIFATLLKVTARSLTAQKEKAVTRDIQGWLSLAALTRNYQNNPGRQLQELNNWLDVWSSHPAATTLPGSLKMLSGIVSEQPSSVALILPFQGAMGAAGRAVRDGFLAAWYEQADNGQLNSTDVVMYDSSAGNAVDLVHQATLDGAELIIGPIARDDVAQVAAATLEVPVLALNRTTQNTLNPEFYQFGLSPEDEIHQVIKQVHGEGLHQVLVIYPDDEWGKRNFEVFRTHWEALGGSVVDSLAFSNQPDYSNIIKTLLKVDQSEQRSIELARISGRNFEFVPRRRQDIDFIFLLADPNQARGINPTLERYYAEDIPVYATSHIHESGESWIKAIDLNRIMFCDIPWKLTSTDLTQTRIQSNWTAAQGQLEPFFALGVDAHRLYPRLRQLKQIPSARFYGATGVLRLNPDNVVERELMWAQFRDGTPVTVYRVREPDQP